MLVGSSSCSCSPRFPSPSHPLPHPSLFFPLPPSSLSLKARSYVKSLPPFPKKDFYSFFVGANPKAIDLLMRLLLLDPDRRPTAEEALSHPYLAKFHVADDEVHLRIGLVTWCSCSFHVMVMWQSCDVHETTLWCSYTCIQHVHHLFSVWVEVLVPVQITVYTHQALVWRGTFSSSDENVPLFSNTL